jgi:hypothetical protein
LHCHWRSNYLRWGLDSFIWFNPTFLFMSQARIWIFDAKWRKRNSNSYRYIQYSLTILPPFGPSYILVKSEVGNISKEKFTPKITWYLEITLTPLGIRANKCYPCMFVRMQAPHLVLKFEKRICYSVELKLSSFLVELLVSFVEKKRDDPCTKRWRNGIRIIPTVRCEIFLFIIMRSNGK